MVGPSSYLSSPSSPGSTLSETATSDVVSDVGDANLGSIGVDYINFDGSRPRKFAHLDSMDYWVCGSSGSLCKQIKPVFRLGILDFQYAVHTHCLRCEFCTDWFRTLSIVEAGMVGVIEEETGRSVGPNINEVGVRVAALVMMAVKDVKINKKKRL